MMSQENARSSGVGLPLATYLQWLQEGRMETQIHSSLGAAKVPKRRGVLTGTGTAGGSEAHCEMSGTAERMRAVTMG